MKTLILFALLLSTLCWLAACDAGQRTRQTEAPAELAQTQDKATTQLNEEAAAPEADEANVPKRQFVRTADLKCRVDNVVKATERVETIVAGQGGFVTHTALDREVINTETVAISADSSLETTHYSVSSTITLRVPNDRLDTTLRAVTSLAAVLDHRQIDADDVALQLLATEQVRRRNAAYDQRMRRAIDGRDRRASNRLSETTTAEKNRLNQQQATDEALIDRLSLTDQVRYSTVTLALYERPAFSRTVLPNPTDVRAYEPSFGQKALAALAVGSEVLEGFVLLLLKSWGLFLFGFVAYALFRYVRFGKKWQRG